ncbi:WXG100 family type VII secretion target [Streptomyces sp. NPDC093109]|uniref:WXG100 family type VII secretion target n=1 Tax=Streptomyces sp. NPDC093109 TaxID=3154977 RepID=UPI00344DB624
MADDGTMIVTYSSLDQAAGSIRDQARKLGMTLDAIKAQIQSVADVWEGEAKQAYHQEQAKWDKDAAEIQANLAKIATAVDDASVAYRSGDKRAAANFH